MKKILNGKMYNTETAKELANRTFSNPRDFNYINETLYQKKNGEYFLFGEGGGLTKYAFYVDSSGRTGGWEVIPMTEDDARERMGAHCDADEYIAVFGEPEE